MKFIDKGILCSVPWSSVYIKHDGVVHICNSAKPFPIGNINDGNFLNTVAYKRVRDKIKNNVWAEECISCQRREQGGGQSHRQRFSHQSYALGLNEIEKQDQHVGLEHIKSLYISFSNVCDLSCRLCTSMYSSKWKSMETYLSKNNFESRTQYATSSLDMSKLTPILNQMKNLEYVCVEGGEPFLSKGFARFLKSMVESGRSEKITIEVTSNGLNIQEEQLKDLEKFKKSLISYSLDGLGGVYSYTRGGRHKFSKIEESIDRVGHYERIYITTNFTFQIYNMLQVKDFFRWNKKMFPGPKLNNRTFLRTLMYPQYLNTSHAPDDLKAKSAINIKEVFEEFESEMGDKLIMQLHSLREILRKTRDEGQWKKFIEYTRLMDKLEEKDFGQVEREIAKYI